MQYYKESLQPFRIFYQALLLSQIFMLDNLPAMVAFARIVSEGSLSAAARSMDLPLSVISKRLVQLEKSTGVRLLERTTRSQRLTQEGQRFHQRVVRILDEVAQAETELTFQRQEISGVLRVTATCEFGRRRVVPLLAEFHADHPQLTVQLDLSDSIMDLQESGFDLALRFGNLPDSDLVARKIVDNYRVACASPAYLATFGEPSSPAQLSEHRCILIGDQPRADWHFSGQAGSVRVTGSIITNDGAAAHDFALQGAGIAIKSMLDIEDDVATGRLRVVLPAFTMPAAPLHAVYPNSQRLAPRVRALVEFLREKMMKIRQHQEHT